MEFIEDDLLELRNKVKEAREKGQRVSYTFKGERHMLKKVTNEGVSVLPTDRQEVTVTLRFD